MEEQLLAQLCVKGNAKAQEELYKTYSPRLFAVCLRYISDRHKAEDILQDAFIKIFNVIHQYRFTGPGSLYSWMTRVTINLCLDSLRHNKRFREELLETSALPESADEPDFDEASSIPAEKLRAMVDALPDAYRAVFQMYCIDGMSHAYIARSLGIKEKSSASNLARARSILMSKIKEFKLRQG